LKKKILIAVKTYPTISTKYSELVCTAGLTENGDWIRLYPIPFRKLDFDKQYKKYQWIIADIENNSSDPRPESHKVLNWEKIELGDKIGTENGTWTTRKELVLNNIYTNRDSLVADARDPSKLVSLAVFKPTKLLGMTISKVDREWDPKKLAQFNQTDLFETGPFKIVSKLPYKFKYVFKDDEGNISRLMIEDWEIGRLYWRMLEKYDGDEDKACADVKKKYWDDFAKTKDLYLFLGTTQAHHFTGTNPFLIIGTFHPKTADPSLFD